jgi:hypothetical protein
MTCPQLADREDDFKIWRVVANKFHMQQQGVVLQLREWAGERWGSSKQLLIVNN